MVDQFSIKASAREFKKHNVEVIDFFTHSEDNNSRDVTYYFKIKFENIFFYLGINCEDTSGFTINELFKEHISDFISLLSSDNLDEHYFKLLIENQCSWKHSFDNNTSCAYSMNQMNALAWKLVKKYPSLKDFCIDIDNVDIDQVYS